MPGIKTASLELSKRLQELAPGWDDTEYFSIIPVTDDGKRHKRVVIPTNELCSLHEHKPVIAPDLDWLLGKLGYPTLERNVYGIWLAKYYKKTPKSLTGPMNALGSGSTPCDAACALLIKLLEQKVIEV